MQEKPFIVIMAGGIGSRFWPYSRRKRPKQFLDILGTGRTLLQMTYDRFREIAEPEQFFVITYRKYVHLVKEQLPELEDHQILSEPNRKNTAPCIAYAGYKIHSIKPGASMIITPSDHLIQQEGKFFSAIKNAIKAAQTEERLITIGIKPNRPETGYGYIQYVEGSGKEALKVKTFTEKPNVKLAKTFLESGDFVWNSGMFVWKSTSLVHALEKHMPDLAEVFHEGMENFGTDKEPEFISKAYTQFKNISVDYGLMEKSSDVYVILGDFTWSDLGSWRSLHEIREKDEEGNVVEGNALLFDTKNSFIRSDSEKLVVVEGLENYLVSESENVLLICPLDGEKRFRQFVTDARKKGEDFI
ncbi:mannose-1-phosphate guanylyltransferase [Algoriphagus kandeliae]|uniref:mannose-1-phosphate guanylyltransferase n=1 Tax=Algoriphagus kandeliae TaxID=2562278 RepID=A0A4Y9QLJ9_9BACT|nr:mannose-1-phosphate guanylyltransferase [Algoriphagus kandeliae]TFV93130.1 mannose-1-phosphate guanylyltransferase [Algoriphagus kandeliae]